MGCCVDFVSNIWMKYILMWMALMTIMTNIGFAVLIYYIIPDLGSYYNLIISIASYFLFAIIIHFIYGFYSRPYLTDNEPKHLVFIVSGWIGFHLRMTSLREWIKKMNQENESSESIMVFVSQTNSNGYLTFPYIKTNDGITKGGDRIYKEVMNTLNKYPSIEKISFIGCSLGGLYSRYVIHKLFIDGKFDEYKPINYISLASPHIGIVDYVVKQKMCCMTKSKYIKLVKYICCCNKYESTSNQLILNDGNNNDDNSLLYKMANNDEYILSLNKFSNILCYGNIKFDALVPFKSACILTNDEIVDELTNKYVNKTGENELNYLFTDEINDDEMNLNKNNDDDCWYKRLNEDVNWKKIGVYLNQNSSARSIAHQYLSAPVYYYEICDPLYKSLKKHLIL